MMDKDDGKSTEEREKGRRQERGMTNRERERERERARVREIEKETHPSFHNATRYDSALVCSFGSIEDLDIHRQTRQDLLHLSRMRFSRSQIDTCNVALEGLSLKGFPLYRKRKSGGKEMLGEEKRRGGKC